MSNIRWMYRNHLETVNKITENSGTANTIYGTSKIIDNNLQTYFHDNGDIGTGFLKVLFDMGTAIYADTFICNHNLPTSGTLILRAGTDSTPLSEIIGLPISGIGTAIKYNVGVSNYRYWELAMQGTTVGGLKKLKEMYIGKRIELPINPEYPFENGIDSSTIMTVSEKGQRNVYHKYTRRDWKFSYPAVSEAIYGTFNKIRRHCNGSFKPLYLCIDNADNALETFFVRFKRNSFRTVEIIDGIYDIEFEIEEEL